MGRCRRAASGRHRHVGRGGPAHRVPRRRRHVLPHVGQLCAAPALARLPRWHRTRWSISGSCASFSSRPAFRVAGTKNCEPQRETLLSTSKDPLDAHGWSLHGAVFPFSYTSGASLLFRDGEAGPHLAFVCNSNTAAQLLLAESDDGVTWRDAHRIFMQGRPGCWDEKGVAAGPQPERLSNGDYLYVYNIDTGFPYHPNPLGRCAIGWAILDGADPTQIVARSDGPLMVAMLPWETCPEGKGWDCQEPMVVFSTGLKPLGNDEFMLVYGAADTDVGVARIKVAIRAGSYS